MNRLFYILLVFLLSGTTVLAEMYECDGVWMNRPCGTVAPKKHAPRVIERQLETSASEILAEPAAPPAASPAVKAPSIPAEKRLMLSELQRMNRACGSYYSIGALRQFERDCFDPEMSISDCHSHWADLHSEMLGRAPDEKCRSAIFAATNRVDGS